MKDLYITYGFGVFWETVGKKTREITMSNAMEHFLSMDREFSDDAATALTRRLDDKITQPGVLATINKMAKSFYGFGRWEAPYWFLGPEQGMAKAGDGLEARCKCWDDLGRRELIDCVSYHRCLGYTRFHEPPYRLQPTWRKLILTLLTFKGELPSRDRIRKYQATKWGTEQGETCVIDLSGLAAPTLKTPRDRKTFLAQRLSVIRTKIREYRPKFVVAYGKMSKVQFEQLVGGSFDRDGVRQCDSTIVLLTAAPTAFGQTDEQWKAFGLRLRERCEKVSNAKKQTHTTFGR